MDLYEQYGRQLRESNAQNLMLRYSKKTKQKNKTCLYQKRWRKIWNASVQD